MVEADPDEGVYTLEVSGRRVVTGREGLDGVMIEGRGHPPASEGRAARARSRA
jgi:hypothetical protein